jgi:hypothetical protein
MTRERAPIKDVLEVAGGRARAGEAESVAIDVRFGDGTAARLDPTSARDRVWAEVLESLRDTRQPAYVEIDPKTRYITSLLLPQELVVTDIREIPGTVYLEIDMEISEARHYLRREHPRFDELRKILERARRKNEAVLVTESLDGSAIVDVSPARKEPTVAPGGSSPTRAPRSRKPSSRSR